MRLVPLDSSKDVIGPIYDRVRLSPPACSPARARGGRRATFPTRRSDGRAGARRMLVLELDGEPAGYALYRIHTKFESGAAAGHVDVIEALADGPVATRELWRVLLDMDWKATLKAYLLRSTTRSCTSSATRAGCSCASATGSGSVSSTSAPRSPLGLRRRRRARARARGRLPAGERGPLADRGRNGGAHGGRRRPRLGVGRLRVRTWAGSPSPSSRAPASCAS